MTNSREPNRLIHEKSPYLLQHAYNPVNWFPWSCHAFEKAAQEDKRLPIYWVFLEIGKYWLYISVMASVLLTANSLKK